MLPLSNPVPQSANQSISQTKDPLSKQAIVITSGTYKSDIVMPERKTITRETNQSTVERESKAYAPPSVKSSKSTKSYKKSNTSSKKFLFFFKKTSKKASKYPKYRDSNKVGCYKF